MAGFGKTPTTTTQGSLATNQFPASSVYPPNKGGSNPTDDFFVLEGGPITTDDDGNKSAPAGLYIKDGGDVTKGTQADAAWSGSGSATEIAILKKLVALLSAALTVSGSVTANIGTSGTLALETGGNLASAKTDLDAIVTSNSAVNTAVGVQADAAWSGSGNGSEIAILKKIVAELAATLTISGSVSVSNLPGTQPVSGTFWQATQPVSSASLPLPAGAAQEAGHLATIDSHTPASGQALMASSSPMVIASDQSNVPANIKAVNGAAIAVGSAALPILTSAATGTVALWGTNPTTTGIATDISIKWGASGTTQINHGMIANNTAIAINYELDATSTLGSDTLASGQKLFFDIQTTVVHLQAATSQNVNGSSTGNIVVRGWL